MPLHTQSMPSDEYMDGYGFLTAGSNGCVDSRGSAPSRAGPFKKQVHVEYAECKELDVRVDSVRCCKFVFVCAKHIWNRECMCL